VHSPRLTYANVVSTLALVFALSGGAYAATQLPARSVGPRQLRNGAVTNRAIARNAVSAADLRTGAVTARALAPGSVGVSALGVPLGFNVATAATPIALPGGAFPSAACLVTLQPSDAQCGGDAKIAEVTITTTGRATITLSGTVGLSFQGTAGEETSAIITTYLDSAGEHSPLAESMPLSAPEGATTIVPFQAVYRDVPAGKYSFDADVRSLASGTAYPVTMSATALAPTP
jgi:hypothetical protein